jgi:hypothetical protein
MATDKRERQRANRAEKQVIAAKEARRARTLRIAKRVALYVVLIVIVFVILNLLTGNDTPEDAGTSLTSLISLLG